MDRRWISPRATADYLGCHLQTIYAWIASGEIPSARIGRKVLVDRIRLDKRLEAQLERQSQLRGRSR
jgi:excisionase family DNA binding protein